MLKVTDEMLTGMEEIFKTQLQASDVLAVWNAETEEMQLEIYFQKDGIEFFGLENALKKAIFKRLGCI